MTQPAAYRFNHFQTWRSLVKLNIVHRLFGDTELLAEAQELAVNGVGRLKAENAAKIDAIVDFYRKADHYIVSIKEKSTLKDLLADDSVAFVHRFAKGANAGKNVLGFTDKSALVAVFGEAGLTESLVPEFMRRMDTLQLALHDADGRATLKVDFGGKKRDCYVVLDPRYHSCSEVPC